MDIKIIIIISLFGTKVHIVYTRNCDQSQNKFQTNKTQKTGEAVSYTSIHNWNTKAILLLNHLRITADPLTHKLREHQKTFHFSQQKVSLN